MLPRAPLGTAPELPGVIFTLNIYGIHVIVKGVAYFSTIKTATKQIPYRTPTLIKNNKPVLRLRFPQNTDPLTRKSTLI